MQEEALQGNENIEQAIAALQQNATPELLAHALTAIRPASGKTASLW